MLSILLINFKIKWIKISYVGQKIEPQLKMGTILKNTPINSFFDKNRLFLAHSSRNINFYSEKLNCLICFDIIND